MANPTQTSHAVQRLEAHASWTLELLYSLSQKTPTMQWQILHRHHMQSNDWKPMHHGHWNSCTRYPRRRLQCNGKSYTDITCSPTTGSPCIMDTGTPVLVIPEDAYNAMANPTQTSHAVQRLEAHASWTLEL